MADGHLPDGLPIWPDQVSEQLDNGPNAGNEPLNGGPDVGHNINHLTEGSHDSQELYPLPAQRDDFGRFLPGHSIRPKYLQSAREAKEMLANYAPFVAKILIKIFGDLPIDRPDLILAYAKEILDRGLGKPTQNVQVNEERVGAEYKFFQAVICNGDEQTIREAQALAVRMESYARDNGGASVGRQMEVVPPPGGTLNFANSRRDGQVSEAHNLDASTDRQE